MGMSPPGFLTAFVEGNYDDCVANPDCLRRAFNAAVSTSHLADHYYEYHRRHTPTRLAHFGSLAKFNEHVATQVGQQFEDIRSISNAYKHLYESKKGRGGTKTYWSVSSAGSIECITFGAKGASLASVEQDYLDIGITPPRSRIIFRRRDGTQGEFLPSLKRVVDFWSIEVCR